MTRHRGRSPSDANRRQRALATVVACAVGVCAAVVLVQVRGAGATPDGSDPPGSDLPSSTQAATGLDPELQRRFAVAQEAAEADAVTLTLTSGWRSAADQQALVDGAIARYGSLEEARRWVLPPESSAHVQGKAIDVGPTEGALWLGEHGFELGLCRAYENELWHFEMRADGADRCPDPKADSSSGW